MVISLRRVLYDRIVDKQESWKEVHLPEDMKAGMIALTNKLMHKLINNDHDLDKVSLFYPEDCNDYSAFMAVAYGLNAYATLKEGGGGVVMHGFGCNHDEIEVE